MTTNIFKPILFSTEMVQAILAGRKTQTRRVLKLKTPVDITGVEVDCYLRLDLIPTNMQVFFANKRDKQINLYSDNEYAKYKPGDILWIRETTIINNNSFKTFFVADGYNLSKDENGKYCEYEKKVPSIYMPKNAARIFLKVTNVRCEKLQDISEGDSISEGVELFDSNLYKDYEDKKSPGLGKARVSFATLWDSINAKKHPWESNPWVWVYDFERTEKPENFI